MAMYSAQYDQDKINIESDKKEIFINIKDLNDIISLIKQRTRNYAKRQYTYFNHQLPVNWFNDYKEALAFKEANNETK